MTMRNVLLAAVVLLGMAQHGLAQWHSIPPQGIDLSPGGWTPPDGTPDYWVNTELDAVTIVPATEPNGYLVTITNGSAINLEDGTLTVQNLPAFYGDPAKHISAWDMAANPAGLTGGTTPAYPLTLPPKVPQKVQVEVVWGVGAGLQPAPVYHVLFLYPEPPTFGLWASATSGNWSSTGNWTGGVPNSAAAWAVINPSTDSSLTVTLDSPETVGTLIMGNAGSTTVGYTLSGTGANTLTLDNSGNGATISVTNGNHVIDARVVLADNLVVSGSGTLAFPDASSITGGYSLTMSGAGGTLVLSGSDTYTSGTVVNAGTLFLTSSSAIADGTSLTVGTGAALEFDSSAAAVPVINAVPEPAALTLLGVGAIGLLGYAWRKRR